MSKQDITLPKTPTDIERKYKLGRSKSAPGSSVQLELQVQQLSQTLSQFMTTTNGKIAELEKKILPKLDYTVTFKADNGVYEIMSVKIGNSINAPTTEPTSESGNFGGWCDAEGNTITFPFTPTSDIELTAMFISSYASELYSHFGMSKEEYPYVAVGVLYSSNKTRVYFTKEPLNNVTRVSYKHVTANTTSGLADVTDAKTVVEWVKSKFVAPFSFNEGTWTTQDGTYFANYSIENTDTVTCYPL